jgi:hypothetical protein
MKRKTLFWFKWTVRCLLVIFFVAFVYMTYCYARQETPFGLDGRDAQLVSIYLVIGAWITILAVMIAELLDS